MRPLTEKEQATFIAWAQEHYQPFADIEGVWHPVVQAECVRINARKWLEAAAEDDPTFTE